MLWTDDGERAEAATRRGRLGQPERGHVQARHRRGQAHRGVRRRISPTRISRSTVTRVSPRSWPAPPSRATGPSRAINRRRTLELHHHCRFSTPSLMGIRRAMASIPAACTSWTSRIGRTPSLSMAASATMLQPELVDQRGLSQAEQPISSITIVGVVYKPMSIGSLYAAYATSANPFGSELDATATDYGGVPANTTVLLGPERNKALKSAPNGSCLIVICWRRAALFRPPRTMRARPSAASLLDLGRCLHDPGHRHRGRRQDHRQAGASSAAWC